jgi:hypothetical protein
MIEPIRHVVRRKEIIRIAVNTGAARNGGLDRYLVAWVWNRPLSADRDLAWHVENTAIKMGAGYLPEARIKEVIARSRLGKPLCKPDDLGEYLKLDDDNRTLWGITTIGARDVTKRQRTKRRKVKQRERMARLRLQRGARPHSQSFSQTKPWEADGISRSTWERRRKKGAKMSDANSCAPPMTQ